MIPGCWASSGLCLFAERLTDCGSPQRTDWIREGLPGASGSPLTAAGLLLARLSHLSWASMRHSPRTQWVILRLPTEAAGSRLP